MLNFPPIHPTYYRETIMKIRITFEEMTQPTGPAYALYAPAPTPIYSQVLEANTEEDLLNYILLLNTKEKDFIGGDE